MAGRMRMARWTSRWVKDGWFISARLIRERRLDFLVRVIAKVAQVNPRRLV